MPTTDISTSLINRLLDRRDALRRRVLRHRAVLAAVLAAVSVTLVVRALAGPAAPTESVWVAAHDLRSGTTLSTTDFVRRAFAAGTAPPGVVADPARVEGRVLATPVGAGMPLAREAVIDARWLRGRPDISAVPVRLTDPAVAPLLAVGDRVDLVAIDPEDPGSARTLVRRATILALPRASSSAATTSLTGRLVVVGVPPADVSTVTGASVRSFLTVVWSGTIGGS